MYYPISPILKTRNKEGAFEFRYFLSIGVLKLRKAHGGETEQLGAIEAPAEAREWGERINMGGSNGAPGSTLSALGAQRGVKKRLKPGRAWGAELNATGSQRDPESRKRSWKCNGSTQREWRERWANTNRGRAGGGGSAWGAKSGVKGVKKETRQDIASELVLEPWKIPSVTARHRPRTAGYRKCPKQEGRGCTACAAYQRRCDAVASQRAVSAMLCLNKVNRHGLARKLRKLPGSGRLVIGIYGGRPVEIAQVRLHSFEELPTNRFAGILAPESLAAVIRRSIHRVWWLRASESVDSLKDWAMNFSNATSRLPRSVNKSWAPRSLRMHVPRLDIIRVKTKCVARLQRIQWNRRWKVFSKGSEML
ncbi:hypothetical protein B0H14DRAFT_2659427 [Mycena olivaceomarginata]|nr:hypothetical protein B0H14DRAFT_2659427 [Mycena olivaceomarginata]